MANHPERIQPTGSRLLAQVPRRRLPLETHWGRAGQRKGRVDVGYADGGL